MRKNSIMLVITGIVIAVGVGGNIIYNYVSTGNSPEDIPEVMQNDSQPTENGEQIVYEPGLKFEYTGEEKISNVDISIDEINQLKVYALNPPDDEWEYVSALAKDYLGDAYGDMKVNSHSHESVAGPEMEGWGIRYNYTDKETGEEVFEGGLYSAGAYGEIEIGDAGEEEREWFEEFVARNNLGIRGEAVHMEFTDSGTAYRYTPYFGKVPKAVADEYYMSGSMDPPDEQKVRYEGYIDLVFNYGGGMRYFNLYSMEVVDERPLSANYSSVEDFIQKVQNELLQGSYDLDYYDEVVLGDMELYYNIGIKNDGTFIATPWVVFRGRETQRLELGTDNEHKVTSNIEYDINLETGRVYVH